MYSFQISSYLCLPGYPANISRLPHQVLEALDHSLVGWAWVCSGNKQLQAFSCGGGSVVLFCSFILYRISLCSLGWPWTCNPPTSVSQLLSLQVHTTRLSCLWSSVPNRADVLLPGHVLWPLWDTVLSTWKCCRKSCDSMEKEKSNSALYSGEEEKTVWWISSMTTHEARELPTVLM